ncbi:MAG: tetratricopeptide repeat protein [Isosphaeraceae bacterium]
MITESDVAAPCEGESPVLTAEAGSTASPTPRTPPARRGRFRAVKAMLAVALVAGLVAFNLWWYWRDTRPVADLPVIEAMITRQQYTQAEAALRERLRRAPHDGEARTTLGRVLAARGDYLACARELDRLPAWWPKKNEALFREAQAFLIADRARDAEATLLALMDADPLHLPDPGLYHDAGQELMKIYATENRWDDFYDAIWKAYDHSTPQDQQLVLGMRMKCELERVAPAESIKLVRRYVAADPEDFEALRSLANTELALGLKAEAIRDMEECLRRRPEDPRAWRDYLTMLQSLGEMDAFNAALARVPAAAEVEPEIWLFRGQASERQGDWAKAAEYLGKALELNPNLLNAHYRLAMVEDRQGHREQSADHRKRWQELREARTQLRQADAEYQEAMAAVPPPGTTGNPALRSAVKKLASICETLGWTRVAEGWNRVALSL